jgi:hypothetical protein
VSAAGEFFDNLMIRTYRSGDPIDRSPLSGLVGSPLDLTAYLMEPNLVRIRLSRSFRRTTTSCH